ncbi:MAG: hypothetical protein Q9169_007849 [Polycauliona sp. 2 TL-2023]
MAADDVLAELLQCYQISGYQDWDQEFRDVVSVSSDSLTANRSTWHLLRSAVKKHPDIAHRALAMELGLDYDRMRTSMEGNSVSGRIEPIVTPSDAPIVQSQDRKRRREDSTENAEAEEILSAHLRRSKRKITR